MPDGSLVFHEPKIKFDLSKSMEHHNFIFDAVFEDGVKNPMVYADTLRPLLPSVIQEAAPVTMFAYGQTGTGKTFTISGLIKDPQLKGIMPRAFENIFEQIKCQENREYLVRCSYLEIYNEEIRDLLAKKHSGRLDL